MKQIISFIFLPIITLTGCTLYQKPKIAPIAVPAHFKNTAKLTHKKLKRDWWRNFNDSQLNQLVDKAIKENISYKMAIKNIQISQTYVTQATSFLLPQVNLNLNAQRIKLSKNAINTFRSTHVSGFANTLFPIQNFIHPFTSLKGFLSTTYELDVWNQIRNSANQAKADVAVSTAFSEVVRLTLITEVVSTYFQIRVANSNLANLQRQLYFANELLKLNRSQFKSGLVDAGTVDDAKNQIETIKINISTLQKQKEVAIDSLAYLLGEYPENFNVPLNTPLKVRSYSGLIPQDIPSSVLSRRPDICEAFYQIVSYGYLEKQNLAHFLPSFSLTGNYGYSSPSLSNFLSGSSVFWNYGANILQPLFDFGLRMSEYKRSKNQFEAAFLNYRNTVINALSEVDKALSSYQKDDRALHSYQRQSALWEDKSKMAKARFRSGLADENNYLLTRLSSLQVDYNLINQQLLVLQDIVQVYKTLGLGLTSSSIK